MQQFVPIEALFKGRHFDGQIIILCVSWYTSELSTALAHSIATSKGIGVTVEVDFGSSRQRHFSGTPHSGPRDQKGVRHL